MIGIGDLRAQSALQFGPPTRGICTSVTRHCVSSNCGDCRNSSQDVNVRARQPRIGQAYRWRPWPFVVVDDRNDFKLDNWHTRQLMRSRNYRNRAVFSHKWLGVIDPAIILVSWGCFVRRIPRASVIRTRSAETAHAFFMICPR